MKSQRRILGYTRRRFSTSVETQIERAVIRECERYAVSRSFVIANALAFTFGIRVDEYIPKKILRMRKVK